MAKVLTTEEAQRATVDPLPPAGDARREELARRTDALAEAAETQGEGLEAIDPNAFTPDREIQHAIQQSDGLNVPYARADFKYKWVNADIRRGFGNRYVTQARAEGWEPVKYGDDDAKGLEHARHVDNTILVGDVVLMRIRLDRYLQLRAHAEGQAQRQREAITGTLEEMAHAHRDRGVIVHTNLDVNHPAMRHAAASSIAKQQFSNQLRSGTVPGLPVGRR